MPDGSQHPNRTIGFGPDGMLYITELVKVIEHLPGVADIEYDARHGVLAVPLTSNNRVEFYKLPPP